MKWIITANTNHCCIYENQSHALHLIKEIDHPENKLKNNELGTDRPGRYKSGVNQGAFTPHSEPENVNVDNFARELALELEKAKNKNSYDQLILLMPTQMEGLLSKHLSKNVKELITCTIHKNIMHLSEKEILELVEQNRLK